MNRTVHLFVIFCSLSFPLFSTSHQANLEDLLMIGGSIDDKTDLSVGKSVIDVRTLSRGMITKINPHGMYTVQFPTFRKSLEEPPVKEYYISGDNLIPYEVTSAYDEDADLAAWSDDEDKAFDEPSETVIVFWEEGRTVIFKDKKGREVQGVIKGMKRDKYQVVVREEVEQRGQIITRLKTYLVPADNITKGKDLWDGYEDPDLTVKFAGKSARVKLKNNKGEVLYSLPSCRILEVFSPGNNYLPLAEVEDLEGQRILVPFSAVKLL